MIKPRCYEDDTPIPQWIIDLPFEEKLKLLDEKDRILFEEMFGDEYREKRI